MSQILPGQRHSLKDCGCCHADDAHGSFPSGKGTEVVVLCQGCLSENWSVYRQGLERSVQAARDAVAANPGSDGHALMLELAEAALDIFDSRQGVDSWDEPRMRAAEERLATAQNALAALVDINSKGNA